MLAGGRAGTCSMNSRCQEGPAHFISQRLRAPNNGGAGAVFLWKNVKYGQLRNEVQ